MSLPYRDLNKVNPFPLGTPKKPVRLFLNQSSNAASTLQMPWGGGAGTFAVQGTLGSGTCALQCSYDGGANWVDVGANTSRTAVGVGNFELGDCLLRANLTGSSGASVTAFVRRIF